MTNSIINMSYFVKTGNCDPMIFKRTINIKIDEQPKTDNLNNDCFNQFGVGTLDVIKFCKIINKLDNRN